MPVHNKEKLFEQLFTEYKEKLYRLCFSYCNQAALAEDLLQESFSKIWQHLEKFENRSAYSTWMYRITVNTCLMHIRSNQKNSVENRATLPEVPAGETYQEDSLNQLYKSIQQLNEPDRLLISLVLEDVSYKQIAEIMGLRENNVGVKVHRIKGQLKVLMTKMSS